MTSISYKFYKTADKWIEKNYNTIDTIFWANAVMWQILLALNVLTTKNWIVLVPVIITIAAITFLEKFKKKHKSKRLQMFYTLVYSVTYGGWMGFTFLTLLSISGIM